MSIASEIQRIKNNIAAAYSACESKGANMPQLQNSNNLADTINSISQGGISVNKKDVNFFDYDGTLLYSYTLQEARSLSNLPAFPVHSGLTIQGWNYSLAQIQSAAMSGDPVDVGAIYITDDGSTRLYIYVAKGTRIHDLQIWVELEGNKSATVEWGDGTSYTLNNTGSSGAVMSAEKTDYAEANEDVILCVRIVGGSFKLGRSAPYNMFGENPSDASSAYMTPAVVKVEIGSNCTGIRPNAFVDCYDLAHITVPQNITEIGSNAFKNCLDLSAIILPNSITRIESCAFYCCYDLTVAVVPQTVTWISSMAFQRCYGMKTIVIPHSVTVLQNDAFLECRGLDFVSLTRGASNIQQNTFQDCHSLISVEIPQGVNTVSSYAFRGCYSLEKVKVPSTVTQIDTYAFEGCRKLYLVDLTSFIDPAHIPVLSHMNAFYNTPSYIKFLVANQQMIDAFATATSWSNYAGRFAAV